MTLELAPARSDGNLREIAALARTIWQEHYPGIISQGQIDYMLARGYSPAAMHADIEDGMRYVVVRDNGAAIAFAGHAPDARDAGTLWLHKLYVAASARRRGIGRRLLAATEARACALGRRWIQLRVNRHNGLALIAYERLGFVIAGSDVADIGAGFMMDDLIMRRAVALQ